MKSVSFIQRNTQGHWVGDGFPVRTLFSYNDDPAAFSPFLMLDYGGPVVFEPTTKRRGVGAHPHRGFETVTIVYDGEVTHRDSSGGGGTIGPGEVQWMTAAAGIVHEEFHSEAYARSGGPFRMVQLWVNLPARDKMAAPGYQGITAAQIPTLPLTGVDGQDAGTVRPIAGSFDGASGPARTFTPMQVWDVQLKAGHTVTLPAPEGHTTVPLVYQGRVKTADGQEAGDAEMIVYTRDGEGVQLTALADTTLLWLCGEPIDEPVVGYGPFVMNTPQEIQQAFVDFQSGRMGRL
ncbi:pirin family protein [Hydrogenophaga pseudoflava]|uniref:Quercetin 2,3-dioxygenase n=1 Tax=Hydrogenophaga pseudoflava TaxID=47421 RepID=A0A4V1AB01_HYDPS|nr:pirin family protein [Hydrogenophaga pseudoflava]QBM26243.1 Quercetin 2,3-dioxygenase [Hydrogenophaga pseudoflava]